jgi:hypothetical protein
VSAPAPPDSVVFEDTIASTVRKVPRAQVPRGIAEIGVGDERVFIVRVVRSREGGRTRIDQYDAEGAIVRRTFQADSPPVAP